ncbi:MAG: flagellar export chaperone FliS [Armatimonadetes bacterium]|nr:flagellar export chaperone FliS [Armatimonadota bacterium]
MNSASAYAQYQRMEVETSRERLVLLLYNGLLRFLGQASAAMQARQYEQQGHAITRAQRILLELRHTLNFEAGGEIARGLAAIYSYCLRRLTDANFQNDEAALAEVIRLISDLHGAWVAAEQAVRRSHGQAVEVAAR